MNSCFKRKGKQRYVEWLHSGTGTLSSSGTLKRIGHQDILKIIHEAWNTGFTQLITRACRKGGLGLALDGSEDDRTVMGCMTTCWP
jgi:hypothetical protein